MSAWEHRNYWNKEFYNGYRKHVARAAYTFAGHPHLDCADLSISLLIDFAFVNGLPLTFKTNDGSILSSKTTEQKPAHWLSCAREWSDAMEYKSAVLSEIGTYALWNHNTQENLHGPLASPGDLMIRFHKNGFHHTALVSAVYPPGASHRLKENKSIPDYPGGDQAEKEKNVWIYFRGTVDPNTNKTVSREPDEYVHIDILNWRTKQKGHAEVILFANAYQYITLDSFEFRHWSASVTDNWRDWDGRGDPPKQHQIPIDGFN